MNQPQHLHDPSFLVCLLPGKVLRSENVALSDGLPPFPLTQINRKSFLIFHQSFLIINNFLRYVMKQLVHVCPCLCRCFEKLNPLVSASSRPFSSDMTLVGRPVLLATRILGTPGKALSAIYLIHYAMLSNVLVAVQS